MTSTGDGRSGAPLVAVIVVVNGTPTEVTINQNAPLQALVAQALEQTSNSGQPPENWELRDAAGAVLDLHDKIETLNVDVDTRLFLNLRAGIGG
jgi:hypothetical protein